MKVWMVVAKERKFKDSVAFSSGCFTLIRCTVTITPQDDVLSYCIRIIEQVCIDVPHEKVCVCV